MDWKDDNDLFDLMKTELFTAVVGDVLDKLGYRHQFLPQAVGPLRADMVVAGRAMTVLNADYFVQQTEGQTELSNKPFGLTFRALDNLKPNEVYVATGGRMDYAMWGELMATRAIHLKAKGAVLDGFWRDSKGILDLDFPTFGRGAYAQDAGARAKVVDFRVPVEIDDIRIVPGDIIFGDTDGVLVVPQAVEEEAISQALEKARTEDKVREAIQNGMSTTEAFEKFGVM